MENKKVASFFRYPPQKTNILTFSGDCPVAEAGPGDQRRNRQVEQQPAVDEAIPSASAEVPWRHRRDPSSLVSLTWGRSAPTRPCWCQILETLIFIFVFPCRCLWLFYFFVYNRIVRSSVAHFAELEAVSCELWAGDVGVLLPAAVGGPTSLQLAWNWKEERNWSRGMLHVISKS